MKQSKSADASQRRSTNELSNLGSHRNHLFILIALTFVCFTFNSTTVTPTFRELNELRKPTSDNPDILRFFKYMRAAKDGQDGVDCDESFAKCKELKDLENPAMLSTYNDINKLVQARKLA